MPKELSKIELKKKRDIMRGDAVRKLDEMAENDLPMTDLTMLNTEFDSKDFAWIANTIKSKTVIWLKTRCIFFSSKRKIFIEIIKHAEVPF